MNIDKNKRIKVTNRTSGSLAYHIETLRMTRHWRKPGDYLNISIGELLELKTSPGGQKILSEALIIEDSDALAILFPDNDLEPEYHYGLEEIKTLLYSAETAQLQDALDYAPQGVLNLIKSTAVEKLPNTTDKIAAIDKKFNIDLIKMNSLHEEKIVQSERVEKPKGRRAKPLNVKQEEQAPKYKVVNKE